MGNTRQPAPAATSLQTTMERMRPLKPLTIPEHVVGSHHSFFVPAPTLIGPAKIASMVYGTPHFQATAKVYDAGVGGPALDIEGIYQPTSKGVHETKVSLLAIWADHHEEHCVTTVTASARDLTEPPSDAVLTERAELATPSVSDVQTMPSTAATPDSVPTRREMADAIRGPGLVNNAVVAMFDKRKNAIDRIERESEKYKPQEAEKSIWWDIAALALTLGTSGVGGVLAQMIETRLKATGSTERVAKFVSKVTEQSINRSVSEGVKYVQKNDAKQSAPNSLAFFDIQRDALVDRQLGMANDFTNGLADLASISTDVLAVTEAITAGLSEISAHAEDHQTKATALQLVAYQARTSMGGELWKLGVNKPMTTDMRSARELTHNGDPKTLPTGLLELHVGPGPTSPVVRAEIHGVSKLVASRLLDVDLKTAGLPLRFSPQRNLRASTGSGVITRDESGVIRYGNEVYYGNEKLDEDSSPGDPEAQSIRSAQRIVNSALSKTLAGWGAAIETDDQGKT